MSMAVVARGEGAKSGAGGEPADDLNCDSRPHGGRVAQVFLRCGANSADNQRKTQNRLRQMKFMQAIMLGGRVLYKAPSDRDRDCSGLAEGAGFAVDR